MTPDILVHLLKSLQIKSEGLALYVTSGACDSYEDYRFHAGLLEGLQMAGDLISIEAETVEMGKLPLGQGRSS